MCLRIHVFETRASECRQICQIKLKLELSFNQTAPSYFWLSVKDEYPMLSQRQLKFYSSAAKQWIKEELAQTKEGVRQ